MMRIQPLILGLCALTVTAPELPGAYEVRYVLREGRTPVGRLSVTVEAPAGSSSAGPRAWPRCRTGLPRFCSSGAELDTSGAAPAV